MEEKDLQKFRFDFLTKAIEDTQHTVRFSDGKAGAVITFWGIVLTGILRTTDNWVAWLASINGTVDRIFVFGSILLMLLFFVNSIWIALKVIVPKINPAAHVDTSDLDLKGLFYLHQMSQQITGKYLFGDKKDIKLGISTGDFMNHFSNIEINDILRELVFELQKVSFIRNIKVARANNAIALVGYFCLTFGVLIIYGCISPIFHK